MQSGCTLIFPTTRVCYSLKKHYITDRIKLSTESLIELAELVLKNNCFEFNDRFRKQKESTAIGTGFTPTHAIILTATLGEEILEFLF